MDFSGHLLISRLFLQVAEAVAMEETQNSIEPLKVIILAVEVLLGGSICKVVRIDRILALLLLKVMNFWLSKYPLQKFIRRIKLRPEALLKRLCLENLA